MSTNTDELYVAVCPTTGNVFGPFPDVIAADKFADAQGGGQWDIRFLRPVLLEKGTDEAAP